ncbi:MAG: hypothetical protein ABIK28_15330 [Planctomycetota bacterium]
MIRCLLIPLTLLLALACSRQAPIPEENLWLHLDTESQEIEFGKSFPLVVTRVWSKALVPESFNEMALAPLTTQLESCTRREDEKRIEEVRHYRSYAFDSGEIVIPAIPLHARDRSGGAEQETTGNRLVLRVRSSLPENVADPPELPGPLMNKPFPSNSAILFAALALLASLVFLGYMQRKARRGASRPAPRPSSPGERALARLERLCSLKPRSPDEIQDFYVEASSLVRDYLSERFAVHAPEMTTEELASALDASHYRMISEFLGHCDLVKFGGCISQESDRKQLVETAWKFVETTRSTRQINFDDTPGIAPSDGGAP